MIKVRSTGSLFSTGDILSDELNEAPNPKPTFSDKARFGKLASLYTAFSCEFASYVLEICLREGLKTIGDPFGGMGTLAEAGREHPVHLHLSDISPFAALSGTFRAASRSEINESAEVTHRLSQRISAETELLFFTRLLHEMDSTFKVPLKSALVDPSAPTHRLASLAMYLVALGRTRLYRGLVGSNPTWVKRPDVAADGSSARQAIEHAISAGIDYANRLQEIHPANHTTSIWSNINARTIAPGHLDAIITSPPYANRTDYFRHYLPATELLLSIAGRDERVLRSQQIGTPLIRNGIPEHKLPDSALNILDSIRTHPSYASERYYYKSYLYYFSDMACALNKMHTWIRPGGLLFMVVQESFYKDVHVPTPTILTDLAVGAGFSHAGRRDWRVQQRLSRLSPHSRKILSNRCLSESLIVFSRSPSENGARDTSRTEAQ